LGDYEILGQIKIAVKFAKEKGFIGPFLERLLNCVLQSSKAIKTKTMLSGGTVSVSFAAIQYIKEHIADVRDKKIMLLGTGKIGRITCKNIVDYLKTRNITLINRTEEKALQIAEELGLKHASMENLDAEIAAADIIIVATNATTPTILKGHLEHGSEKLIIDLSVPCNVAADAQQLGNITFINVDDLSKIKDETLQKRQEEVPKALEIIDEHIEEFVAWHNMRKYAPLLKAVKNKLKDLNTHPVIKDIAIYNGDSEEKIQKVINVLAIKMRSNNTPGCQYIAAINEYIA
jgi:glutamyl-tRNA reductase